MEAERDNNFEAQPQQNEENFVRRRKKITNSPLFGLPQGDEKDPANLRFTVRKFEKTRRPQMELDKQEFGQDLQRGVQQAQAGQGIGRQQVGRGQENVFNQPQVLQGGLQHDQARLECYQQQLHLNPLSQEDDFELDLSEEDPSYPTFDEYLQSLDNNVC